MKRFVRGTAILVACFLVAAGCSSEPKEATRTTGKYGSGVDLDIDKKKKAATRTAAPAAAPRSEGTPQQETSTSHETSKEGGGFKPNLSRKPIDGGDAGVNAFFFLNRSVPSLVVEIDAVRGYEPTQATITLLNQRLNGFVDKPAGVRFLPVESTVAPRDSWSEADMLAAEGQHRDTHNTAEQSSIYLLFVNGEPRGPFIGVAYTGSSAGIMAGYIRGIGSPLITAEAIEKATTLHEVGHLFALVNQTYKSPRDHEDAAHRGHSNNRNSVMYWAVESPRIVDILGGRTEPPTTFDADDLADLADLKTGKLP